MNLVEKISIDFDRSLTDPECLWHFTSIPYISVKIEPHFAIELIDRKLAIFDLYGMRDSLEGNGEAYIINCGCGAPSCVGINSPAKVIHQNGNVEWHIPQPIDKKISIPKGILAGVVGKTLNDICKHYDFSLNEKGFFEQNS